MTGPLDHLGLTRWPFPIVPEKEFCTFLGDRTRLQTDVAEVLESLSRRDTSSIHLFWAWFGAGKTHTLYYLENKAAELTADGAGIILYTVYSEFPKNAQSFVNLYRSFVRGLSIDILTDAFLEISTCPDSDRILKELSMASLDLVTALHVMTMGRSQDQIAAMRWLWAEALPVSEFRKVGISQKIGSSEDASRIISALAHLLMAAARARGRLGSRVLWLLDEFQRIERTGARAIGEINAGLHSTFNACPTGLSLCLSFSGRPQANLPRWFSPELRDRIGRTKVMILPPMLPEEGLIFVRDVLAHSRPLGFDHNRSPFFPFSESACKLIIEEVAKRGDIKPRAIMQAFSSVLEEADPRIERGELDSIQADFARHVLSERLVLTDDMED